MASTRGGLQPERTGEATPGNRSLTVAAHWRTAPPSAFRLPPSRGLTLIELLIVLTILVLLISSAIPVVSPSSDERRLREASRGINAFLAGAQARAVQSGRPFGVMLKKLSQDTSDAEDNAVCLELLYVEQPSPYSGFSGSSRVIVSRPIPSNSRSLLRFVTTPNDNADAQVQPGWVPDLLPPGLIRPGDIISINGIRYELLLSNEPGREPILRGNAPLDSNNAFFVPPTNQTVTLVAAPTEAGTPPEITPVFDNDGDRLTDRQPAAPLDPPLPYWTKPLRYSIARRPVPTSAPPYQLPEGTAIDLRASGTSGTNGSAFHRNETGDENRIDNPLPVMIMFSPNGSVSQLIAGLDDTSNNTDDLDTPSSITDGSDVHLLVGLRENIPAVNTDFSSFTGTDDELREAADELNWLNGQSRWVSIGRQTGLVITTENAAINPVAIAREFNSETFVRRRDRQISAAREFATQKSSLGGK